MVDISIVIVRRHLGRADRRDRLGPDHLVLRAADELVARAVGGFAGAAVANAGSGAIILAGWTKTLIFILLAPLIGLASGSC